MIKWGSSADEFSGNFLFVIKRMLTFIPEVEEIFLMVSQQNTPFLSTLRLTQIVLRGAQGLRGASVEKKEEGIYEIFARSINYFMFAGRFHAFSGVGSNPERSHDACKDSTVNILLAVQLCLHRRSHRHLQSDETLLYYS